MYRNSHFKIEYSHFYVMICKMMFVVSDVWTKTGWRSAWVRGQGWSQPPTWKQRRRSGERLGLVPASYLETEEEIR